MPYNTNLAGRIREYLLRHSPKKVEEKKMFSGLSFLVNDKMCINVSGENLMCRFDPALKDAVAEKKGFHPMVMKGKELKGYCYVDPTGFTTKKDFEYWLDLCLQYMAKLNHPKRQRNK